MKWLLAIAWVSLTPPAEHPAVRIGVQSYATQQECEDAKARIWEASRDTIGDAQCLTMTQPYY